MVLTASLFSEFTPGDCQNCCYIGTHPAGRKPIIFIGDLQQGHLKTGRVINDKYFFPLTTIKIPVSHSFLTC